MTSCGSTLALHHVAMRGCKWTAATLLNPASTSFYVFKNFTRNVALHYLAPGRRTGYHVQSFPWRASGTQSQLLVRSASHQLNAEQMAAVQTEEARVRLVAGPGSGKTLVLTHRIVHLIENRGVDPSKILCLTFTNKAKNEVQERLGILLGDRSSQLTIGTFHGVCVRMLRESIGKEDFGVDKEFVIYDTQDSLKVIKKVLETIDQESTNYPSLKGDKESTGRKQEKKADARAIQDGLRSIAEIKEYELKNFLAKQNQLRKLPTMPPFSQSALAMFKRYQSILRSCNAVDFYDLIYLTVRILYRRSELCQKYQNRWKNVLIDEFQDTDWAQYALVRLLCGTNQQLFVVGDVDQAIYGWRGADYRHMDDLEKHFQGLATLELRRNYRSSSNILKLASDVINGSSLSRHLQLQPMKARGRPVTVVRCPDSDQEAIYILEKISTLVARKEASYSSFAVLYRTRAQSEAFEKLCLAKKIPYTISGSNALLSYQVVKDLRAYLQLIWNSEDRVALDRIINTPPRGLGPKTLKSVEQWASDQKVSFHQALQKVSKEETSHKDLGITLKARNSILEFCKLQEDLVRLSKTDYVSSLVQEVFDRTQMLEYYKKSDGNDGKSASHLQLFKELVTLMDEEHGSGRSALGQFLEAVALSPSLDEGDGKRPDVVKLSTLHGAKGLEFDFVFITGAEDGTLPLINSDPEEERRLFYVGLTRARKDLVITSRKRRLVPGLGFKEGELSRFLSYSKSLYKEETFVGSSTQRVMNGYATTYK